MRGSHRGLVLFLMFVLGASLALPAEDIPDTSYDESESLPLELTPSFVADPLPTSTLPVIPQDVFSSWHSECVPALAKSACRACPSLLRTALLCTFRC